MKKQTYRLWFTNKTEPVVEQNQPIGYIKKTTFQDLEGFSNIFLALLFENMPKNGVQVLGLLFTKNCKHSMGSFLLFNDYSIHLPIYTTQIILNQVLMDQQG